MAIGNEMCFDTYKWFQLWTIGQLLYLQCIDIQILLTLRLYRFSTSQMEDL